LKRSRDPALVKVVLDTSSYVAALLSPGGNSAKAFELIVQGKVSNFYTEEILKEIEKVIARRKFKLMQEKQVHFVNLVQESSFQLPASELFQVRKCRDPNDDKFLSLAGQVDADFILSWDQDLLILKKVNRTRILTPSELLKEKIILRLLKNK